MDFQNCKNDLPNFATSNIDIKESEEIKNTSLQKIFIATPEVINNLNYLKIIFSQACIKSLQSNHLGPWIHLIEVINLLKQFSGFLLKSDEIIHYLVRLYDYCNHHEELYHLKIQQLLENIFPEFNFNLGISKSISSINSRIFLEEKSQLKVEKLKEIEINKVPYIKDSLDIFQISPDDLQNRIYEPRSLSLVDIQKYLPKVVSDLTKLESTWSNALGLTITTINTALSEEETLKSISPTFSAHSASTTSEISRKPLFKGKKKEKKSGKEVVESLVAASRRKEIQIYYLNVVPSIIYNPYNLAVATKSTIKKEHVVMSVFGVLHVRPNGDSNLTPLGQWYKEAVCFETMNNIPFFKNFTITKCFNSWVRYRKFNQFLNIKKELMAIHLSKIPSFPSSILNVQYLLLQSHKISLLPICKEGKLDGNSIVDVMTEHITTQRKYLRKLFASIESILNKCHTDCVDYFNYCVAHLNSDVSDQESLAIIQKRREKQLKNRKSADQDLKRFSHITNLINQMVLSNIVCKLTNEIQSFIRTQILNNSNGFFYCKLETNTQDVALSPEQDELFSLLEEAFGKWLVELETKYFFKSSTDQAGTKESPHTTRDLTSREQSSEAADKPLLRNRRNVKPSLQVKDNVLNNEIVKQTFSFFKDEIRKAYSEGKQLLSSFQWLDSILIFFAAWNPEEFEVKIWSVGTDAEKQIMLLKTWKGSIEQMRTSHISENGVLFIDTSQVQVNLLLKLERIFNEIISILTQKLASETGKLFSELTLYTSTLKKTCSNATEFAKYYVYINSIQLKVPSLQDTVNKLKAAFELIKLCNCQLTSEEDTREEKMWTIWENFMFTLQNGNNMVVAQVPSYIDQLNKNIKDKVDKANNIVIAATSGEFLDASNDPAVILPKLKKHYQNFNNIFENIEIFVKCLETISGFKENFKKLLLGRKRINSRYESWKFIDHSTQAIKEWNNTEFSKFQLNVNKILQKLQSWFTAAKTLKMELDKDDQVFQQWISLIKDFNCKMQVLKKLTSATLKEHHWRDIFLVLGHFYNPTISYRVSDILSMNLVKNAEKVFLICAAASSEYALHQCLNALIKQWEKKNFTFRKNTSATMNKTFNQLQNRSMTTFYILTGVDKLVCQLEDSLLTLESMLVSPHIREVKDLINHWNSELQEIKEILDIWLVAQQQWMYMSQIFSFKSAQENHPNEFSIFKEVNAAFVELIKSTMSDSKVLHILEKKRGEKGWREYQGSRLKDLLFALLEKQTSASKAMDTFVAKVQEEFPRLYFWSKGELLSLITYTPNPASLIPIAKNCFPSIHDLTLEMPSNTKVIESIDVTFNLHLLETISIKGDIDEVMQLRQPIPTNITIEEWLKSFYRELKFSFSGDMMKCIQNLYNEFGDKIDVEKWSNRNIHREYTFQSILIHCQIICTGLLNSYLEGAMSIGEIRRRCDENVNSLTEFLQHTRMWTFNNNTDKRFLLLAQALLLKVLHFKEAVYKDDLLQEDSFDWFKMVRFSHDNNNDDEGDKEKKVWIDFLGMRFEYGFEYLGPTESLVHTTSTDRCIISSLLALKCFHAACFYGDAGSGRTKAITEVGKLLGRYTYTLPCTPHTTMECLQQLLKGALRVGCFLYLDNVNVLPSQMLSVCGHLLEEIHQSFSNLNLNVETPYNSCLIKINGEVIKTNTMYGCLIASDRNFMQWKAIPDNLRRSLNPIGVKFPNYKYLFESWLMLHGFASSRVLSKKLTFLLDVAKNQIGLTASKIHSIIATTAKLIHIEKGTDVKENVQLAKENVQLAKCLVNSLRTSVTSAQYNVFTSQVQSIFTLSKEVLISSQLSHNALLVDAIKEQITAGHLNQNVDFVNKVLDLQTLLSNKKAVILYGACATGKSTCYQTLSRALNQFHSPWSLPNENKEGFKNENFTRVNLKVVYPNTLNHEEIYGCYESSTRTWSDGLLVKLLRRFSLWKEVERAQAFEHGKNQICCDMQQWLVLDGAVDTTWVSEVEGLLDAYSLVVMENQKILKTTKTSRILFEMESLQNCTPSLLSKTSWLYFPEQQIVDWHSLYYSWSRKMHSKHAIPLVYFKELKKALVYTLEPTVQFLHQELAPIYHQNNREYGKGELSSNIECGHILQIFSVLLHHWIGKDHNSPLVKQEDSNSKGFVVNFLCHALAFSFAHALSPLVVTESLPKLDMFIRQIFSTCPPCNVIFPASFTDCYFDGISGELKLWNEQKAQTFIPLSSSSFVVTKQIQQCYYIMDMLLSFNKNCLLLGEVGAGKTMFIKHLLTVKHGISRIQISSAMTIHRLQSILLEKITSIQSKQMTKMKLKKLTSSSSTKQVESNVIFLDDLNAGDVVANGGGSTEEQPLREFVRQLVVEGGCYNTKGNNFYYLPNVQLLLSHSSQSPLPLRFVRNFSLVNYPKLDQKDWCSVFNRSCQAWIDELDWMPWKYAFGKVIVGLIMNIHSSIRTQFPPSVSPTYIFSHHLLAKVVKRVIGFRATDNNKKNTKLLDSKVLCKFDFDLYFSRNQGFIDKSVSEYLIAPPKHVKKQADLLLSDTSQVLEVVCAEFEAVYKSRLVTYKERTDFTELLRKNLEELLWKNSIVKGKEFLFEGFPGEFTKSLLEHIELGGPMKSALKFDSSVEPMIYTTETRRSFQNKLTVTANKVSGCSFFVLDDITFKHLHNLHSVLQTTGGHALLISDKSHGRRKNIKIISKLMELKVFEVLGESRGDGFDVIKDACNAAGLNGKPVLLSVQGTCEEEIFKCVSALLCDGFCPGFYTPSELTLICTQLLPGGHLNNIRKLNNISHLIERFFQRVKNNLQIVVSLKHADVANFCYLYPNVLHKFHLVDHYGNNDVDFWSSFCLIWLEKHMHGEEIPSKKLSRYLGTVHYTVKQQTASKYQDKMDHFVSPLKVLECLQVFQSLFKSIKHQSEGRLTYLGKAMSKVSRANEDIDSTMTRMSELEPLLTNAKKEAFFAEKQMKEAQEIYFKIKKECEEQSRQIEKLRIPCQQTKQETIQDFESLSPLYDAALHALSLLDSHALDELKSFLHPPEGVRYVTRMLCVLFGVSLSSYSSPWEGILKLIRQDNFHQQLQCFDKDNVSDNVYHQLTTFVNNPNAQHHLVARWSIAAEQLCLWLHAIHSYCTIFRQLQPKKQKLKEFESKIAKAESKLCEMKLRAGDLRDSFEKQILNYRSEMKVVKQYEKKKQTQQETLDYIRNLLNAMSPFTSQWEKEINSIQEKLNKLPVAALSLAVHAIYSGFFLSNDLPLMKAKWQQLLQGEIEIPDSGCFRDLLLEHLTVSREQNHWSKSIDIEEDLATFTTLFNIRIIANFGLECWPLLIDPFGNGEDWIKMCHRNHEEVKGPKSVLPYDDTSERTMILNGDDQNLEINLKKALERGFIVLIKRIECCPKSNLLTFILSRRNLLNGFVTVNGERVECNTNFRLYMSTGASLEGLMQEDLQIPLHKTICHQLQPDSTGIGQFILGMLIGADAVSLETQHHRFSNEIHHLNREEKSTREKALSKIMEMKPSFLDDRKLCTHMEQEREHLWLVQERLFETQTSSKNISQQRNEYLPLASHVSKVFDILTKLKRVHPAYHFDFAMVTRLLEKTMKESISSKSTVSDASSRIDDLCRAFTKCVNDEIGPSFFAEHKLLFLICVVLEKTLFPMDIFLQLLSSDCSQAPETEGQKNDVSKSDWISTQSWNKMVFLSTKTQCFENLLQTFQVRAEEWKEYFQTSSSLLCPLYLLPDLTTFEISLLWLAYDKSKITEVFTNLILCFLGPEFLDEPQFSFSTLAHAPWCHFVIVPADENPIVEDPAITIRRNKPEEMEMVAVSMGTSCVYNLVLDTLDNFHSKETCLILQNCHLVKKWPKDILHKIQKLHSEKTANRSRLWLISRDWKIDSFPEILLRCSTVIAWRPFNNDARSINSIISERNNFDSNDEFLMKEIQKNYEHFYSQQYKNSTKERKLLEFLRTNAGGDGIVENLSNEIVFRSQLSNSYDDVLFATQNKKHDDDQLKKKKNYSHESYTSMLSNYFGHGNSTCVLLNDGNLSDFTESLETLKEKLISYKHPRAQKFHTLNVLLLESQSIEKAIDAALVDLHAIKNNLIDCKQMPDHLCSVYKTISEGRIPRTWLAKTAEVPFDMFSVFLERKWYQVEEILQQIREDIFKVDLHKFEEPFRFIQSLLLDYKENKDLCSSSKFICTAKIIEDPDDARMPKPAVILRNTFLQLGVSKRVICVPYILIRSSHKEENAWPNKTVMSLTLFDSEKVAMTSLLLTKKDVDEYGITCDELFVVCDNSQISSL